tara:strand:- start:215 stop:511 length:297 start_codon:yes stop_codon:yes gene_type:complete
MATNRLDPTKNPVLRAQLENLPPKERQLYYSILEALSTEMVSERDRVTGYLSDARQSVTDLNMRHDSLEGEMVRFLDDLKREPTRASVVKYMKDIGIY